MIQSTVFLQWNVDMVEIYAVLNSSLVDGTFFTEHWAQLENWKVWYRKGSFRQETGKALLWMSCYFGIFTACRGWWWWQETRTLLSICGLALPQTHHVSMTKFPIYWAVIMFACFTVGLRVCNSGDCPCSYIDRLSACSQVSLVKGCCFMTAWQMGLG